MEYQVVIYVEDRKIKIRYAPYLYKRFRALPTSTYSSAEKNRDGHPEFHFPARPQYAYLIHEACLDLDRQWRQEEFNDLVNLGKELRYNRFRSNNAEQPIEPELIKTEAWDYQLEAYTRMQGVDSFALFMEPGCGKSKCVIDYIANTPSIERVLVVGPNRVIDEGEWERQFERHYSEDARPYALLTLTADKNGSVTERANKLQKTMLWKSVGRVTVVLVNYESIWREPLDQALIEANFDLVVMDESHRIKAAGSKVSQFAAKLGEYVPCRFALTGTPMPNNPLDLYGQYRFLDPTIFGTNFNAFKNRYAIFGGYEGRSFIRMNPLAEEEFERKIADTAIRVKQRPFPVQDQILYFHLPPAIMRKYREMEKEFYTYINGKDVEVSNVLSQLIRLQQIASGFLPIYEEYVDKNGDKKRKVVGWDRVHDAKQKFLKDLLDDLPKSKPIVVYAVYTEQLEDIRRASESLNLRYGEISGRRSDYQSYILDEIDVIGIQIVAGSEGLNELVKSDIGIYYATGYYLGKYEQSRARLARPGQESDHILFYHIHAEGTIEEEIYSALMGKQSIVAKFMPNRELEPSTSD